MAAVLMADKGITQKCVAIVQFGPATPQSGFRAGEYYQVTIDPNMSSPSGEFIRFGLYPGDEVNGWQRVAAMTISEVLHSDVQPLVQKPTGYKEDEKAEVVMRHIEIDPVAQVVEPVTEVLPPG